MSPPKRGEWEGLRLQIHQPVVAHAMTRVKLSLFDPVPRYKEEVRDDHQSLPPDHIERGVEDFTKTPLADVSAESTA